MAPLILEARINLSIPVLTSVLTLFVGYIPMAIRARILGGLVQPYSGELA